ncbi:RNA binding domain-containing protein [Histoplasma capsulatum]|uniref:RNA binding domain-containing protein n=1 Tax=Ajellomyces capsulatus TaxID=5037 RepID=A0A8A1LZM1_AJECA|nr:RNA binding domain-containing protein [Histoplasma capsulatum]
MSLDMWWVALRSCITEPSLRCCAFFRGILPLRRGLGNSEYFHKSAGPVKKVMLTYNQNGTSRGIASITFIEVVLDASRAPTVPAVKPLTERVAQPKPQPKPVSATKASAGSRRSRNRRGRNVGRPKPKSIAELDAEMEDYFPSSNTVPAATNGAAQPAAAGGEDLGMDEISEQDRDRFSIENIHIAVLNGKTSSLYPLSHARNPSSANLSYFLLYSDPTGRRT